MDVIAQGDLAITNGNRHTTFSFQIPATRNIEFDKWDQGKEIQDAIEENDRRWIRKLHDAGIANEKIAQVANKAVDEVGKIINRQRQNEKAHTV
jgi:hypothetical protein